VLKFYGNKRTGLVMAMAGCVLVMMPVYRGAVWFGSAPSGLLAMIGSFGLFALGTGFAVWRKRFVLPAAPETQQAT
jgi:hypothetical protein